MTPLLAFISGVVATLPMVVVLGNYYHKKGWEEGSKRSLEKLISGVMNGEHSNIQAVELPSELSLEDIEREIEKLKND